MMTAWRGVVKDGEWYFRGAKGQTWTKNRSKAMVFTDAKVAALARGSARLVRLRKPSERRRDEHIANGSRIAKEMAKEQAIEAREREAVAAWLDTWLRLNQGLLENRNGWADGETRRRAFIEGMVCVLSQVVPRIRARDFRTTWEVKS